MSDRPRPSRRHAGRDRVPGVRSLSFALGTLLLLALSGALLIALAVEVQAGTEAYVVADARWTRAAESTARVLQLYLATGEESYLQQARQQIEVPLAAREARLALEQDPPDLATARTSFAAVLDDPAAAERMVRFYRTFANTDTGSRLVGLWRVAEAQVLRLEDLVDTLEAWHPLSPSQRAIGTARMETIAGTLPPLAGAFTRQLRRATDGIRNQVLWATAGGFLFIAAVVAWSFQRAFRAIRSAERYFRESFEQAALGMARLDPSGAFLSVNPSFARMLGRSRAELERSTLRDVLHPEDGPHPDLLKRLSAASADESDTSEHRFVRGDGTALWGKLTLSRLRLSGRGGQQLLAAVDDVSEARERSEELHFQARHDRLTGLANRYEVERRLQAALASSRRLGVTHALCFVDLDKFKQVNDVAGHMAGDHLLRQVADVLQHSVRANDTVGRLGGDEFAIVLDHTDAEEAVRAASKLRDRLAGTIFQWEGHTFDIGCSVGVVTITPEASDAAWLLRAADSACYLAKGAGGNRVHLFERADEALAEREGQSAWSGRIREAIDEGRLELYAQSIAVRHADADAGVRFEVLVRLRDQDGTTYAPSAFLAAAERYGLAQSLDLWVARETVRALEARPRASERTACCYLNVSATSLADPEFRAAYLEVLAATSVPPERFCIDIAEDAAMTHLADARAFVTALRAAGHGVSLDGFGSGLASFVHFKNLPVDLVKIDGTFIQRAAHHELDRTLVRAVRDVTRALGRTTLALSVETEEVRRAVEALGVDYLQGHAVHRPEPLVTWLQRMERGEPAPT